MILPKFVTSHFTSHITSDNLAVKDPQSHKSEFLQYLAMSLIALLSMGLAIMSVPPYSDWYWYVIVGSSLVVNLVVFFLNRQGHARFAAHLFCHNFNLLTFFTFFLNLVIDKDPPGAILAGNLMALTSLLAGMLISSKATFGFAFLNTILILGPSILANRTIDEAMAIGFPIVFFSSLIAVVSWLYQRTLDRSLVRAQEAELREKEEQVRSQLLRRDMENARTLQKQLFPVAPGLGRQWCIVSNLMSALETSGDFYDFIPLNPAEWAMVVADVTGKGLAAAMIMASIRSTLRSEARRAVSPARVLGQTNQILCADALVNHMVTAFYGVFNIETMTLVFANAGHPYPFLKRNGQVQELELPGLPLGAMEQAQYDEYHLQLQPGDELVLMSDGVVETMNYQHELFGFDRLAELLGQPHPNQPDQTLETICRALDQFRGPVAQQDDITLIVIGINDSEPDEE